MDEALKQRCAADNLDLFRKIAGHLKIISAHFHNQQMEGKVLPTFSKNFKSICVCLFRLLKNGS